MIDKILNLFKAKGVELTPEEMNLIESVNKDTGIDLNPAAIPDIKHNLSVIEELKASFDSKMAQLMQQVNALRSERDAYKNEIENLTKMIGEERQARELSAKAMKERLEKEQQEKAEALIKTAIEQQKIPAQQQALIDKLKALAINDYEGTKLIIEGMPVVNPTTTPTTDQKAVAPKTTIIDNKVASTANPAWIKAVEEGFAKLDQNINN